MRDTRLGGRESNVKVEREQKQPEKEQEGAPGKTAARKLDDRVNKTGGDHTKARFASAFIERARGNVAGEVAAEQGEFVVHPEEKLGTMTPKRRSPQHKREITEEGQKTER